jgi:hypothetical protein
MKATTTLGCASPGRRVRHQRGRSQRQHPSRRGHRRHRKRHQRSPEWASRGGGFQGQHGRAATYTEDTVKAKLRWSLAYQAVHLLLLLDTTNRMLQYAQNDLNEILVVHHMASFTALTIHSLYGSGQMETPAAASS